MAWGVGATAAAASAKAQAADLDTGADSSDNDNGGDDDDDDDNDKGTHANVREARPNVPKAKSHTRRRKVRAWVPGCLGWSERSMGAGPGGF